MNENSGFKKSIGILAATPRRFYFAIAVFAFEASLDGATRWFRLSSRWREWLCRSVKNLSNAIQTMLSVAPLTSTLLARRAYLGFQPGAHLFDRSRGPGDQFCGDGKCRLGRGFVDVLSARPGRSRKGPFHGRRGDDEHARGCEIFVRFHGFLGLQSFIQTLLNPYFK